MKKATGVIPGGRYLSKAPERATVRRDGGDGNVNGTGRKG